MKKALKPPLQMADQDALSLAMTVHDALTNNVNFPTPAPTMAQLQAAKDAYAASLAKAQYGNREDKAQKNADKAIVIDMLRQLCDYVNSIANGDDVMLATCGFPLSKNPQPVVLGTPQLSVTNGASGELISSTPAVYGAVAYKHQCTKDAAAPLWPEITTTKSVCKITNLVPGETYSLRIVAIGTSNQTTVSEIVIKVAA